METDTPRRPFWKRLLKALARTVGALLLLCVLLCVALNLYLTPRRLAEIASDYAGRYLDADIQVRRISFTIWSTFPHFNLEVDSAVIISRRLRRLSPEQRAKLPADCDTLASFISLRGSINPLKLINDRISLKRLHISGLRLNLVAYDDSVNNYNILPAMAPDKPFVMPRFEAGEILFSELRPITYYSAATLASARINLDRASMRERRKDSYRLELAGDFGLTVERLRLLHCFPFSFSGTVDVGFHPFRVHFDRYNIALGNVRSQVDLSMELGENNSRLTAMRYSVSPFDLMRLFEYLPADWLPHLQSIRSNATLEATVRLTAPYKFSSESLPSFRVDFHVPDSWLSYSLGRAGEVRVHNVGMKARLIFDGKDIDASRFHIDSLSLAGAGVDVVLHGDVTRLFSRPEIRADVEADADFGKLPSLLPMLGRLGLKGHFHTRIDTRFPLDLLTSGRPGEIPVSGSATLHGASYSPQGSGLRLNGGDALLTFGQKSHRLDLRADVRNLSLKTATGCDILARGLTLDIGTPRPGPDAIINVKSTIADLAVSGSGYDVRGKGLQVSGSTPLGLLRGEQWSRLPLTAQVLAASASCSLAADSSDISLRRLGVKADMRNQHITASVSGSSLRYADPVAFARLETLGARAAADFSRLFPLHGRKTAEQWLTLLSPRGSVDATGGKFLAMDYPAVAHLNRLAADFSPDFLRLRTLSARSQHNALRLSGAVSNFFSLFHGNHARPCSVKLQLDIDTVNINQVAGTRRAGQLLRAAYTRTPVPPAAPIDTGPEPSDFRPLLLPRWLRADVSLNARECTYTNLRVLDVASRMSLRDGIFRLDTVRAHTDFGSAHANATYVAASADKLSVSCSVALDTINVVTFFQRFHTLLEMMPEMKNLSGNVSVEAAGSFRLFPDMIMELPSLTAEVRAQGRDLMVRQNRFIRHVCRYLLIHTRNDLAIRNINVHATIHDNQFELYPFILELNRYKLSFMGENDFAGNLYYHISVLHSPIPWHFGVNITGTFSDYHVSFGRPGFRRDRAMHSMRLEQHHRINLVEECRWFAGKFMQKAAESDTTALSRPARDSRGRIHYMVGDRVLLPLDSASMPGAYLRAVKEIEQ